MRAKRKPTVVKYNRLKRIRLRRGRKKEILLYAKLKRSKRYRETYRAKGRANRSIVSYLEIWWKYQNPNSVRDDDGDDDLDDILKEIEESVKK